MISSESWPADGSRYNNLAYSNLSMGAFMLKLHSLAAYSKSLVSTSTLYWLLLPLVCVVGGFAVGIGDKFLSLLIFGVVGGIFLLFLPLQFVMQLLIVVTLLIAGTAEYFGGISQAQWIPFLMALALYARVPLEKLHQDIGKGKADIKSRTPILYWFIAIYLLLFLLTAVVNQAPILQIVVGAKSYLFYWSCLFLILVSGIAPANLDSFWKSIVGVAVLQLPFVLYQHFVIMKGRASMWAADAVVGTFGGDPKSGGSNSTLLIYMLVLAIYTTALHRGELLRRSWWLASLCIAAIVIGLGETKVAVILIPLAFAVVYWDRLRNSLGAMLGFSAVMVVAVGALLTAYQFAYWDDSLNSRGISESVEKSVHYIVDPNNMTRSTGEVGRVAALNLWLQDPDADTMTRLVGYGPGASRGLSTVTIGGVAKRYLPYVITTSTAATLLWDFGVIGLLCFSSILISGVLLAYRAATLVEPNSPQQAGLRAAAAALACMVVMIPYNRSAIDLAPDQFLMVFCLAYGAYWHRANSKRQLPK